MSGSIIINKVNTTSNSLFLSRNNEIDTTGRINEKIQQNKFNYIVSEIKNVIPTADASSDKLIFVFNETENTYTLYNKVNNSNSSYSYNQFDVSLSSTIFITSTKDIFTLNELQTNTTTTTDANDNEITITTITQKWKKIDNLNYIKSIELLSGDESDKNYSLYSGAKIESLLSNITAQSISLPVNTNPDPADEEIY